MAIIPAETVRLQYSGRLSHKQGACSTSKALRNAREPPRSLMFCPKSPFAEIDCLRVWDV